MARGPDVPLSINHSCAYCSIETQKKKNKNTEKTILKPMPKIHTVKKLGMEIKLHTF
jgi:hypothetical protein